MRIIRLSSFRGLILALLSLAPAAWADNKTFLLGGTNVVLQDATEEVGVFYSAMRLNRAIQAWNVDVTLTNWSGTMLQGPVVMLVASFTGTTGPVHADGTDPANPTNSWYDFSPFAPGGLLMPGNKSGARTLTLGFSAGSPRLTARIFVGAKLTAGGLALVRSLNEVGQPLGGVTVNESGPSGSRTNTTDSSYGVATVGQGSGNYVWRFSAPGRLPAWLKATLPTNGVSVLFDPLLVRRSTNVLTFTPLDGGTLTDNSGAISVSFPPGAFSQPVRGVLTPLTAQTLPASLPLGWSPLQAFALELGSEPTTAGAALLQPWGSVGPAEQPALVRWNTNRLQWDVLSLVTKGTNGLAPALQGSGSYALVVPDSGILAPPTTQPGQPLPGSSAAMPDFSLFQATGTVTPQSSPASTVAEQVTAQAHVVFTNTAGVALPSGVALRCQVSEQYQLRDGSSLALPQYERFIVAYQRPGDAFASTLEADFPMRPILLLGGDTLVQATVQVDVYPPSPFSGGLLSASGGRVSAGTLAVSAAAGDVVGGQLVQLRTLTSTNFASYVTNGLVIADAFDLTVAGVTPGRHLTLSAYGLPTNTLFVLAAVVCQNGWYGLQPVERLASDASGALSSLEPSTGSRLPGITGSGQYMLVQVSSQQALISGIARNSAGQPTGGLPARIVGQPWLAFSAPDGSFQLLSSVGTATVAITDPVSSNPGQTSVTVTNPLNTYLADVGASATGPSVAWVSPTNGATAVPLVSSVVVQFTKPVNLVTVGSTGIQLLDTNRQPVAASLTLSLSGTTATLLPTSQLVPSTLFTVQVSSQITDAAGLSLAGPTTFSFTTASSLLNRDPNAQLMSYEPTNGISTVVGTPGIAQPNAPVILVNDTSGRTATVISGPDGSFTNTIAAEVDDMISAVMVNANGTRDQVTLSRQIFQDGSVALFNSGGVVEAQGESGPVQLSIEPGTIPGKTKFKIEPIPPAQMLNLTSNAPPDAGVAVGGFKYTQTGDVPTRSPSITLPVRLEDLQLPNGASPTNYGYGLAIVQNVDGMQVYQVIDRMEYQDGKLVDPIDPFFGLLSLNAVSYVAPLSQMTIGLILTGIRMQTATLPVSVAGRVYSVGYGINPTNLLLNTTPQTNILAGAILSIWMPGAGGIPGRLHPGSTMAVSQTDGRYAALVDASVFAGGGAVSVTATHPLYPGIVGQGQVPPTDQLERLVVGNLLSPINVYFQCPPGSVSAPPGLKASHTPDLPPLGSNAVLIVESTSVSGAPTVNVSLDSVNSLDPKRPAKLSDATLTPMGTASLGAYGIRVTNLVSCTNTDQVILKLQAVGKGGLASQMSYSILFGSTLPISTNLSLAADINDHFGPMVVRTEPSANSSGLVPGGSVKVYFNKAISTNILVHPDWIVANPRSNPSKPPVITLDDSQMVLSMVFADLQTNTTYTFTVGTGIQDLLGNVFDQDPTTPPKDPFKFTLTTAPAVPGFPSGLGSGSGVASAVLGGYGFVVQANGFNNGVLAALDLTNLQNPQVVGQFSLPSFPRDMVLIPGFSFWYTNGVDNPVTTNSFHTVVKRNLAVVVGGNTGDTFSWLRVLDVTDPKNIQRLAATALDLSGQYIATHVQWSAPCLAVVEIGPVDRVSVINLQEFIIGYVLSQFPDQYLMLPRDGITGVDKNGDGDYTGQGESPPMPPRHPADFAGEVGIAAVPDTSQDILDVAIDRGGNFVGVLLDSGTLYNPPTNAPRLKPCYRTLADQGLYLPRAQASVDLTNGYPRRLMTLFDYPLTISNQLQSLDLVICTLACYDSPDTNDVVVLNVTDPLAPTILTQIPLPKSGNNPSLGLPRLRSDGLLVVPGTSTCFLLDPSRFADPWNGAGVHPAFVGTIPGVGGPMFSTTSGVNISALPALMQTAPRLRFVSFPSVAPFDPSTLVGKTDDQLAQLLQRAQNADYIEPSQFKRIRSNPILSDLDPRFHYYVLVEAPGGAGTNIDLALEGLNDAGYPLRKRGFLFPPVQALSGAALTNLYQVPGPDDAPVRASRAWRLSTKQASPYFNFYLSRPFVVVAELMSKADLATVTNQFDRDVLWSPSALRASIDPGMGNNPVVGPFAGRVNSAEQINRPGVEAIVPAFPGDYLQSLNPGPVNGIGPSPLTLNSVSPHNSEMKTGQTDFAIRGRRQPLEFRRTFAGQGLYDGPFGRGWDFNLNQRLVDMPDHIPYIMHQVDRGDPAYNEEGGPGDLLFYTGAGRVIVYKLAANSPPSVITTDPLIQQLGWIDKTARYYLPPKGLFSPLLRFKDGQYVRLEADGRQYWYNSRGRLAKIYDRYVENNVELVYNPRGELITIIDEAQPPLQVGYWRAANDPDLRTSIDRITTQGTDVGKICRLLQETNGTQRDVLYYYTTNNLLEHLEGPEVQTAVLGGFLGRGITRYAWSDTSAPSRTGQSLVAVTGMEPGGVPASAVASAGDRGRDTVNGFNLGALSMKISQDFDNDSASLAKNGGTTTITDGAGFQHQTALDPLGRVTNTVMQGNSLLPTSTSTEYWPDGQVKRVVYPEGDSTEYFYDTNNPSLRSQGNCLLVVHKPGPRPGPVLQSTANYDPYYNLQAGDITDLNTNKTTITLDSDHLDAHIILKGGETETFEHNEFGQIKSHTSIDNISTTYDYTSDGFLWHKYVGGRAEKSYKHTGNSLSVRVSGHPSSITDGEGIDTTFTYDELDRLVEIDRGDSKVQCAYDAAGNLHQKQVQVESGRALTTTFDYNDFGFLSTQRVQNVEISGGVQDLVTVFLPDAFNRTKQVIMPSGEVDNFAYDDLGRLTNYEAVGRSVSTFAYDANGNLTNATVGTATEQYVFDGHNRLIKVVEPDKAVRQYAYDGDGNVLTNQLADANGTLLALTWVQYDVFDRETSQGLQRNNDVAVSYINYDDASRNVTYTDAGGASLVKTRDEYGMVSKIAHPNYSQSFTFDANYRLRQRTTKEADMTSTEKWDYNALNQVTNETDNASHSRSMVPEIDGRVVHATDREGNTVDTAFTLIGEMRRTVKQDGVAVTLDYDAGRHVASVADGAKNTIVEKRDAQGRLYETDLPNGAKTTYSDWDAYGRPRKVTMPRGVVVQNNYTVDGLLTNRVIQSSFGNRNETFTFDGAGRLTGLTGPFGSVSNHIDLAGFLRQIDYQYTFQSVPSSPNPMSFSVSQDAYLSGFRSQFTYPGNVAQVIYGRDLTGRLTSLTPNSGEPVLQSDTWAGESRLGNAVLGRNRIQIQWTYDDLHRVTGLTYSSPASGMTLVDLRYAYDNNGAVVARQDVHRGGRADFFQYDSGIRLRRIDRDVRPAVVGLDPGSSLDNFTVPAALSSGLTSWQPGTYAREFSYSQTDVLTNASPINPNGLTLPPQAINSYGLDAFLFTTNLDDFVRSHDEVGNTTNTLLAVRIPGHPDPVLVEAALSYNDLGALTRVVRKDGVQVFFEYDDRGHRIRRAVTGDSSRCVPSDLAFIYDSTRLIEERDLSAGGKVLRRYFYGDRDDELLAADIDNGGGLQRYYYLVDLNRSVRGLADSQGQPVERVNYDAFGQPDIQLLDSRAPAVSSIVQESNAVRVVFTEPVVPVTGSVTPGDFLDSWPSLVNVLSIANGGAAVQGAISLAEDVQASEFGAALRFKPGIPLSGPGSVTITGGTLRDEWGNVNLPETISVDFSNGVGQVLASLKPPGSTASQRLDRSSVGSPMLFQGQYFDYETGLVYCRSRDYDPYSVTFLQRDPVSYKDSVNHYAAFANNPVNYRDTSGHSVESLLTRIENFGKELHDAGDQASYKQDGAFGAVEGEVLKGVGALLRTRAIFSEGQQEMQKGGGGTIGVINAMRGATVITEQTKALTIAAHVGFSALQAVGRFGANLTGMLRRGRVSVPEPTTCVVSEDVLKSLTGEGESGQGWLSHEANGTGSKMFEFLKDTGGTTIEIGFKEIGVTKRAGRLAAFRKYGASILEKLTTIIEKTPMGGVGTTGTGFAVHLKKTLLGLWPEVKQTIFVSDIDIAWVKVDGRFLTDEEIAPLLRYLNRGVEEAWAAEGGVGVPPHPFRHGAHGNFGDHWGQEAPRTLDMQGARYDAEYFRQVGGPGDVFTLDVTAGGHVGYNKVPRSQVRMWVEGIFQKYPHIFGDNPGLRQAWLKGLE